MDKDNIYKLLEIMARLRAPQGGCPWDLEQTFESIAPYTIEEAYEVAEAIAANDIAALEDELGDLLLQVVFHARIAEDAGHFNFDDVAGAICAKMLRRHPHVFGGAPVADARAQSASWEAIKQAERDADETSGVLADVPVNLPALSRAVKLGKRAARVGFDWPDYTGVRAKLAEELEELDDAVAAGDPRATAAEMGDLLFSIANACRHLDLDPESCLRAVNGRFQDRFERIERSVRESGRGWTAFSLDELESLWQAAKRASE
ncbi:MAG TPA: nucleoside triphosphate pyrophosphohydrolase [Gammaproteobacteria bacterium]|jgi:tetrapyrrole methylase family protein/MazG family protein/ATP diphosphatase